MVLYVLLCLGSALAMMAKALFCVCSEPPATKGCNFINPVSTQRLLFCFCVQQSVVISGSSVFWLSSPAVTVPAMFFALRKRPVL